MTNISDFQEFQRRKEAIDQRAESRLSSRNLAIGGGGPHDPGMEARVAKLEAAVESIQRDTSDLKQDLRGLRADMGREITGLRIDLGREITGLRSDVRQDSSELRRAAERDFRLLFGTLITAVLGLAALMAKGFHWF